MHTGEASFGACPSRWGWGQTVPKGDERMTPDLSAERQMVWADSGRRRPGCRWPYHLTTGSDQLTLLSSPGHLFQGGPETSRQSEGLTCSLFWATFFRAYRGQEWAPHTFRGHRNCCCHGGCVFLPNCFPAGAAGGLEATVALPMAPWGLSGVLLGWKGAGSRSPAHRLLWLATEHLPSP